MPRRKKIPDLSNRGEIGEFISPQDLTLFNSVPSLSEKRLSALTHELNIELDELEKDLSAIRAVSQAKSSNPSTRYDSDIRASANELAERIQKAPAFVSGYKPFVDLLDQLARIDDWFAEAEKDPVLSGLADRDPYRMDKTGRRLVFIAEAHGIYRRYTDCKDWANKNHSYDSSVPDGELCKNPFFRLMRACLTKKVLGKRLGESTLEKNIRAAKKLHDIQKARK
jgi:hypothetical protein